MAAPIQHLTTAIMAEPHPNFIGAVKDEWELYSDNPEDYTIGPPIGFGASSIVYAAYFHPRGSNSTIQCALKVVDLERLPPHALSLLQRETTLMSLSKHPNVLRVRGSWMDGHQLCIAMRLMNKGSAADVMRYGWPGGMEEDVVRCILRQALQGLNYLHINGFIHRDIKAANLLIDDDGTVLLGDLGVAADLTEPHDNSILSSSKPRQYFRSAVAIVSHPSEHGTHSSGASGKHTDTLDSGPPKPRIGKRKSFVGTPCWMAPELIQGRQYDASADIWSFGITALELAQGRPPRSRDPPQKVLMRVIQDESPTLDRDGSTFKYSRAFKDVVDSCLVKDPSQRPTAEQLLQTPFFRGAKKKSYLVGAILKDLPPLALRQERRPLPSTPLHKTVDSWDFTTTVAESLQSFHRRHPLSGIESNPEALFEMEAEAEAAEDESDGDNQSPNHIPPGITLSSSSSNASLSSPPTSEPSSPPLQHVKLGVVATPVVHPEQQVDTSGQTSPQPSTSAPQPSVEHSERRRERRLSVNVESESSKRESEPSSGFWRKLTRRDHARYQKGDETHVRKSSRVGNLLARAANKV